MDLFLSQEFRGGTVHVNLSHSVTSFSSSPPRPPSLHTLSGAFLGFGKFFFGVLFFFCFRVSYFFFPVADQDQPKKKKSMIKKNRVCIIFSSRRSFDLWRKKKGEQDRKVVLSGGDTV